VSPELSDTLMHTFQQHMMESFESLKEGLVRAQEKDPDTLHPEQAPKKRCAEVENEDIPWKRMRLVKQPEHTKYGQQSSTGMQE
jgi:hypothetical protein